LFLAERNKEIRAIDILPFFLMAGIFVLVNFLALAVVRPFVTFGSFAFANPSDPLNLAYFFLILLSFTAAILLIAKYWKKQVVRIVVLGATGLLDIFVFYPLLALLIPSATLALALSITATAILLIALVKNPEWYVIDASAILSGIGAAAMLGISMNVLIAIVLLIGMSAYDAISVYKTKHMIDLASTLVDQKLPIMFVIPKKRNYSIIKETKTLKEKLRDKEERGAFFLGVGDIAIPGILTVSAYYSSASNGLILSVSVLVGTLLGFVALMALVIKGKPQAGLPPLCTGAILGYFVASYLIFGVLAI
jgi:presenilin-like A22 family membrane protease